MQNVLALFGVADPGNRGETDKVEDLDVCRYFVHCRLLGFRAAFNENLYVSRVGGVL